MNNVSTIHERIVLRKEVFFSKGKIPSKGQAKKIARLHIQEITEMGIDSRPMMHFYLKQEGIDPPKSSNDESYWLRVTCVDWWARQIIRKNLRDREARAILDGKVGKGKQIYCSDEIVEHIKERRKMFLEYADSQKMVSDCGDEIPMLDVINSSLSNPTNSLAELMVRCAGFEQIADEKGHQAMFYTMTAPSKYHRYTGDRLNKKYNNSTPAETQSYLVGIWALIRSKLQDNELEIYGFRVVEPHADGTPHWHILLFMSLEQQEQITEIIREYAMREDSEEAGATKHRFTAEKIVKEIMTKDGLKKTSATGYILKYISKNIGFDIGDEREDGNEKIGELGVRVKSWASVWNIRQFQQIGGASVTVWRELRRLKDEEIEDDCIRKARDCCINNDWAGFLKVMGGVDVKRLSASIKLLKTCQFNQETGEIRLNKYQEVVFKVIGVSTVLNDVITHVKKWKMFPSVKYAAADEDARVAGDLAALAALEFYK